MPESIMQMISTAGKAGTTAPKQEHLTMPGSPSHLVPPALLPCLSIALKSSCLARSGSPESTKFLKTRTTAVPKRKMSGQGQR